MGIFVQLLYSYSGKFAFTEGNKMLPRAITDFILSFHIGVLTLDIEEVLS